MRLTIFILALFIVFKAAGQSPVSKDNPFDFTPRQDMLAEFANECFNTNKYNRLQRLQIYPFNKASRIQLISFQDTLRLIPIEKKEVNYSQVSEKRMLNSNQIDQLTAILYNVGFNPAIKPDFRMESNYKCYEPRNGILFLNAAGKAFEFIEICFGCHGTRTSSKKVKQGTFCEQKFDLLRAFFKSTGIDYGTSERPILTYQEIFKLDTMYFMDAIKNKLENKIIGGDTLDRLNEVEQKLFFLLNADNIYRGHISGSGFATFYYNYSGGFYQQTIDALTEIAAVKTLAVLKSSLMQWHGIDIPKNREIRRQRLLEIADKAVPEWKVLENSLYFHDLEDGIGVMTQKEDLDDLIFKYVVAHKESLKG